LGRSGYGGWISSNSRTPPYNRAGCADQTPDHHPTRPFSTTSPEREAGKDLSVSKGEWAIRLAIVVLLRPNASGSVKNCLADVALDYLSGHRSYKQFRLWQSAPYRAKKASASAQELLAKQSANIRGRTLQTLLGNSVCWIRRISDPPQAATTFTWTLPTLSLDADKLQKRGQEFAAKRDKKPIQSDAAKEDQKA